MKTEQNTKQLQEKLLYNVKNGGLTLSDAEIKAAEDYCEGYKQFLDAGKTERLACEAAVELAKANGFTEFDRNKKYKSGDKVYSINRGKAVVFAVIGNGSIADGVNITAAHIDSPRLDLKANPLYESNELALFKTHYYGGIKKYQWPARPLALHGVICLADGKKIEVSLGENENEPCFVVTDLLPHLAGDQMKRSLSEGIKGEELNILVGSYPFKDDEASERVKLNILCLLNEKYGITERDFIGAELELVPAGKARDVGFDKSMIGAYGQDDRVCAYTALTALLNSKAESRTNVCVLTDKEEVGSDGNTGLNSSYLKYFIYDLAKQGGADGREVLSKSKCLSADVNAAFDPTFPDVIELRNGAQLNHGVVITKFTGARGKSGTSDASAEYTNEIERMLDRENVLWQTGELGKVDMGGGGTVAMYIANLNVDTIDVGVPVLCMHAPMEITSKIDVYATYKAFEAFTKHK